MNRLYHQLPETIIGASLQGDRLMDAPTTNAGALISLVPAVIFFFVFPRTLTRGVTAGAIK